jgi:UDPglucose 6-dehydrogenase
MQIAIVGAGYVGLVTAACLAHIGHDITCLDVDAGRIERLRRGELPVHELGLDELVAEGLGNGRLRFVADDAEIAGRELAIVCVGTLDDAEEWNGDIVRAAVLGIAADGSLPRNIVIRSTLLPGTAASIATAARDVDASVRVAHNPEFTREAVAVADFLSPDRVVIGVDGHDDDGPGAALAQTLRDVYAPLDAPTVVTDLTSAETIKVASNVFLAAKITFANEIARLTAATGADAAAVVDGMGLDKRIVRSFLSPGPGWGGSCFPSQARALPRLARSFGVQTPLMDAIWPSNVSQADWLLDGLERAARRPIGGMRVALLGLTFKAGTDDLRVCLAPDKATHGSVEGDRGQPTVHGREQRDEEVGAAVSLRRATHRERGSGHGPGHNGRGHVAAGARGLPGGADGPRRGGCGSADEPRAVDSRQLSRYHVA